LKGKIVRFTVVPAAPIAPLCNNDCAAQRSGPAASDTTTAGISQSLCKRLADGMIEQFYCMMLFEK
jgi:hypothetical protein